MLQYVTGDLLESQADALVNTVNCEGYMGKGIAYQFKLRFPDSNADYIRACRRGDIGPGHLHYFRENGKIVINFPTKNKWREKSKLIYIADGLDDLLRIVPKMGIQSIAIPPLGSGNGGLIWDDVRELLESKLTPLSDQIDVIVYAPSSSASSSQRPVRKPKLSTSALILMDIKHGLDRFNKLRLQKTAYFTNVFAAEEYFVFEPSIFGPYAHSIDVISRKIREFQQYYGTSSTEEARGILLSELVSDSVCQTLTRLTPAVHAACSFVNSIDTDHELECISTVCYIVQKSGITTSEDVIRKFREWSDRKSSKFTEAEIIGSLQKLSEHGVLESSLPGYSLVM